MCAGGLSAQGFEQWMNARIEMKIGTRKHTQTETASLNRGSTSLVDETSAADLVSTAFNFVPVGKQNENSAGAESAGISLYSIYTLATRQDPLQPSVYTRGTFLRQISFTAGREEKPANGTQDAGTIAGARFLVINRREASRIGRNQRLQAELREIRDAYARALAGARDDIIDFLFNALKDRTHSSKFEFVSEFLSTKESIDGAIAMLSAAQRREFEGLVDRVIEIPSTAMSRMNDLIERLQRRPQVAVGFLTTQRPDPFDKIYRAQAMFDAGFAGNWFLTLNGSFDYTDKHIVGGDTRAGRIAGEIRRTIFSAGGVSLRNPLDVAVSGESFVFQGNWRYRTQIRAAIPISAGITLPFSFGYGNRQDDLRKQEAGVYGKFGLTFDFSKIVAALRGQ
jgi:hypothetical protein